MSIDRIDSTQSTLNLLDIEDQVRAELAGDPGASIAACLLTSARDSRNLAQSERELDEQRLAHSEQQQVDHLHEQADYVAAGGLARGLGMIASGGLGMAGAITGLEADDSDAQYEASAYASGGKVAEGAANIVSAAMDSGAKNAEADAVSAGHTAQHYERRLSDLKQQQNEASDTARAAIDAAAELSRTKAAEDRGALFIRG